MAKNNIKNTRPRYLLIISIFVYYRIEVVALGKMILVGRHAHVAEVVEPEFAVRPVCDVAHVLLAALV